MKNDQLHTTIAQYLASVREDGDPVDLAYVRLLKQARRPRPTAPVVPTVGPNRFGWTPADERAYLDAQAEADAYDEANACPPLDTEAPYDAE